MLEGENKCMKYLFIFIFVASLLVFLVFDQFFFLNGRYSPIKGHTIPTPSFMNSFINVRNN